MKLPFILLLSFVVFACNSNTSQTDNSVPQTPNLKITKIQSLEKNTESKSNTDANQKAITSTSQSEKSLPNITYFAKNKSDRFFVDFEDVIAGHPYVGARSPRPHNDAQVYFSNTDQRWINAKKPSDYPPIYAVADGYISLPKSSFYNVVDHSDVDPAWCM